MRPRRGTGFLKLHWGRVLVKFKAVPSASQVLDYFVLPCSPFLVLATSTISVDDLEYERGWPLALKFPWHTQASRLSGDLGASCNTGFERMERTLWQPFGMRHTRKG